MEDIIKELRFFLKLSQKEFANRLNEIVLTDKDSIIYPQTVSNWENGSNPSIEALKKMSIALDISVDFLLGLTEEKNYKEYIYSRKKNTLGVQSIKDSMKDYPEKTKTEIISRINDYYELIKPSNDEKWDPENWNDKNVAFIHYLSVMAYSLKWLIEYTLYPENINTLNATERNNFREGFSDHIYNISRCLGELESIASGDSKINDYSMNLIPADDSSSNDLD